MADPVANTPAAGSGSSDPTNNFGTVAAAAAPAAAAPPLRPPKDRFFNHPRVRSIIEGLIKFNRLNDFYNIRKGEETLRKSVEDLDVIWDTFGCGVPRMTNRIRQLAHVWEGYNNYANVHENENENENENEGEGENEGENEGEDEGENENDPTAVGGRRRARKTRRVKRHRKAKRGSRRSRPLRR